ncbi:MAG: hypothetical protein KC535_00430 [Nanoarchaeota archaeon]|nr:hypothetical protein [Nanoarchaeota archaeon]
MVLNKLQQAYAYSLNQVKKSNGNSKFGATIDNIVSIGIGGSAGVISTMVEDPLLPFFVMSFPGTAYSYVTEEKNQSKGNYTGIIKQAGIGYTSFFVGRYLAQAVKPFLLFQ